MAEVWKGPPVADGGWWPVDGVTSSADVWAIAPHELLHWDGATMKRVSALGAHGHVAAMVGRGEAWVTTGDELRGASSTTFLRATREGVAPALVLPATARDLWRAPDGRIQALSDAGAIWEARPSCD